MSVIQIKDSAKYETELARIRETADKFGSAVVEVLMNFVKLGIKYYDEGNRVVENQIINTTKYNEFEQSIRKEVAQSIFTSLAGSLADIGRYEETKKSPNAKVLQFYKECRKALWHEHDIFWKYTNEDVEDYVFGKIAPILKSVRLAAGDNNERQRIIEANKSTLIDLIEKAGMNVQ